MNDQIFECVVSTVAPEGQAHVAPMGVRYRVLADGSAGVLLMPFKPSTTHDNIVATGRAVLNIVSDARVFAACVTGRRDHAALALLPTADGHGQRLAGALRHLDLRLAERHDDAQRPVLHLGVERDTPHVPFEGLNRAQAAVIEGAVLVSRLHMLPADKVSQEMAYLQIAIDKTAGPAEHEAWGWLCEAVAARGIAAPGGPPAA